MRSIIKATLIAAAAYSGVRLVRQIIQQEVTGSVKWFLDDLVANGALDYGDILDLYDIDLRGDEQKAAERSRSRADHPSNFTPTPDIRAHADEQEEDWSEYADESQRDAVDAATSLLENVDDYQFEEINFEAQFGDVPSLDQVIGQASGIEMLCETTPGAMDEMLKSGEEGLVELIDEVSGEVGLENLERALLACFDERVNLLYKRHANGEALETLEDYLVLCRAICIQKELHNPEE